MNYTDIDARPSGVRMEGEHVRPRNSKAYLLSRGQVCRPDVYPSALLLSATLAAESHRGAIVCREEISTAAHRIELAHQLQVITGWPDLKFDSDGTLGPDLLLRRAVQSQHAAW